MSNRSLPPAPHHARRPGREIKEQLVDITTYKGEREKKMQSQMQDMSATGIGLLHPVSLDIGEQFSITVTQPGGHLIKFLYTVVYCNEDMASGAFHVGGEFLCGVGGSLENFLFHPGEGFKGWCCNSGTKVPPPVKNGDAMT